MANQEHLNKLKEGVEAWNQWRNKNVDILPDLTDSNFSTAKLNSIGLNNTNLDRTDLSNVDLTNANLIAASLVASNLNGANLSGADLSSANLTNTSLCDANLNGADLSSTILSFANLRDSNLIGADLSLANFWDANLSFTNFHGSIVGGTIFGSVDLSRTKGLDVIKHVSPSTIGIDTIYLSQGKIPEVFLRGAGVDDTFISYIRSLVGKPIEYYSCFISYSSKDEAFAKRLYADLQSHNVRCWFAPEDLKWGEKIRTGIDEAIRLHDKLLLILSKSSVASGWVEHEVKAALAKERKEKRVTLFPVRVDKAFLESPLSWAAEIRHERNIGDFTRWKTHDEYEKAFARLLHDLKADSHQTEGKGE